ncbi:MAG: HAMP domain-containing protein, partial [bacterium]
LSEIFAVRLPSIDYILEIDRDLQQLLVAERSLIFAKTGSEIFNQLVEEYETNLKQSEERWSKYKALASDPGELELIPRYEKAREEWLGLSRQIVEARKADTREGRTLALDLTLGQAKEKFEEMRNYLDELTNVNLDIAAKAEQMARKSYAENLLLISILIVLLVGIALVIALLITRGITRSLAQMVRVAQAVSEGNLTVQVETRSGDEVGFLGKALQAMVLSLRDLVNHILVNSSSLASASEELSSSVQEVSRATQEIAKTIAQIAQGSTEQSGGLDKVSQQVEAISQKTKVLSQGTERNLGLLNEAKESVGQNTRALQEIEKALQLSTEAGTQTTQEAQRGNQSLVALIESIQSISQST